MKRIGIHIVRLYIKLGLFFYFKRIEVVGKDIIPKKGPVLFLANHQNALLDALLLATTCKRMPYFLTRAGVFKSTFLKRIFNSLRMLPVYRIRDGWGTIKNNNSIFESCCILLNEGESVAIFPEGNHNLKRTVRPLSKGFTRIVYEALDKYPDIDLQIVPVGVNYSTPKTFSGSAALVYGAPISVKTFNNGERKEDVLMLKLAVSEELKKLTTHVSSINYNETIQMLDAKEVNYLDPKAVNSFINTGVESKRLIRKDSNTFLKRILKFILLVNLILPYIFWKFLIEPRIKEIEFKSTFRFAVSITLVPLWLVVLIVILFNALGVNVALGYLVFVLCLALLSVQS